MSDKSMPNSSIIHNTGHTSSSNTVILRIPKPNIQVIVLGLIALITLLQTIQLVKIDLTTKSTSFKAAPTSVTTNSGSESNTDAPKSMVGGC